MQRAEGIIVRTTRLTDTSLIVDWVTGGHGLVRTVAKGGLRPKSVFAGKLDLFFGAELLFQPSIRGDLHYLKEVCVVDYRLGIRQTYTATLLAGYFCHLVITALEPEHPEPLVADLLHRALNHLGKSQPSLRAMRHFEVQLLTLLGVASATVPLDTMLTECLGPPPASRKRLLEILGT